MKMNNIDTDVLQEMCDSINLLEYAQQTVDFEQKGVDSWFAHCPRHVDKTASLAITPSKNLFHCFSCNCGGNILNWLTTFEELSFPEALNKLANLSGKDFNSLKTCDAMAFYKELRDQQGEVKNEKFERQILDIQTDYYDKYSDVIPQEWLDEGITEESMRKYDIRIDDNANRIVYPVLDADFNLIGVKGRTRFANYKALKLPKYINYKKIGALDFFTGMKLAEPYIKESGRVIIVEGIKTVMKLDGWGYYNAVSAETSDITEQQLIILIRMGVKTAVIAFDEDVKLAKINSIVKDMKNYMNVEVVINKMNLLSEKDSPVDKGREVWEKLYNERIRLK